MGSLDKKLKHLDFIQLTITRMAANSFLLKAWSVTLVAALFALAAKDADRNFVIIAFVPPFLFWLLDAYYLHQEKLYRQLYDSVRLMEEKDIDFSLSTKDYADTTEALGEVFFSKTLLLFYGGLIALVIIIIYGVN